MTVEVASSNSLEDVKVALLSHNMEEEERRFSDKAVFLWKEMLDGTYMFRYSIFVYMSNILHKGCLNLSSAADYKVVCRRPWNHFLPPPLPRLYLNRLLEGHL
jgi:hypothetical protein